jgi:ABC-type multidrug transport system fused ATPase/permease subunit
MRSIFLNNIRAAVGIIPRQHLRRWMLTVPLGLTAAAVESATAACIFALVATISGGISGGETGGVSGVVQSTPFLSAIVALLPADWQSRQTVLRLLLATTAVLFGIKLLVTIGITVFQQRVIARDRAALATELFHGYLAAPFVFHLDRNAADYAHRINQVVQYVFETILGGAANILNATLTVLALAAVLLIVNPLGSLATICFLALWVWGSGAVIRQQALRLGRDSDEALRLRNKTMWEGLTALREIKILGRDRWFRDTFAATQDRVVDVHLRAALLAIAPRLLLEALFFGGMVVMCGVVLTGSGQPGAVLPVLGLYAYVGFRLLPTISGLVFSYSNIVAGTQPLQLLLDDWNTVRPWVSRNESDSTPLAFEHAVEFKNVSFRFRQSTDDVLSGISLSIARGERIGIVGPTGAGKSTLIHLLLGVLHPDSGSVRVDGSDLADCGRAWRQRVGFVPQSIALLDATIRENVALGIAPESVDDNRVWAVLEQAQLAEFARDLPEELDTEVGDRGVRLSGGQRQRVAIARALYHDPDVLLFDEATASLDSRTEREVTAAIDKLGASRTLVVIAHRISTVRDCDRIFVLNRGLIEAQGTYAELLNDNALFRDLASAQSQAPTDTEPPATERRRQRRRTRR